ncbi:MAG: DUF975 family protein [Oscillospiraceae bacterium]|nr:DUF975 family protein [Oscillospiraceae bacterium]
MNVTRQELKARAKAQLDGGIFKEKWLWAVLVCLIASVAVGIVNVVPVVGTLACIVITGPIMYAVHAMFLKQARNNQPMVLEDLLKGFTGDFLQTFLIGLMTTVFTVLWSLLFVIPGIVKAYSYSMAYFIKVDNPTFTWKDCINASKDMMNGHKMELFVQDLSFLGWMIVGSICLGVGTLWVMPYQYATRAHFYQEVIKEYRMRAMASNV